MLVFLVARFVILSLPSSSLGMRSVLALESALTPTMFEFAQALHFPLHTRWVANLRKPVNQNKHHFNETINGWLLNNTNLSVQQRLDVLARISHAYQ